jgi:hypothetical protein
LLVHAKIACGVGHLWSGQIQDGYGWKEAEERWHEKTDAGEDVDLSDYPGAKDIQKVTDGNFEPVYYYFGERESK